MFKIAPYLPAILLTIGCVSLATAAPNSFHKAQSAPEKRLAEIIHTAEHDNEMAGYLLKIPDYDTTDKGYAQLFTDDLMLAWKETQERLVQQDCGGTYSEELVCGVDGNPVTCSQDISETGYLYQTTQETPQTALVSYIWPNQPAGTAIPTYRLIKDGQTWKLDGIDCGSDLKFNMH